ncbi:MAG: fatty acid desaturase [Hyphomicrobiales bacterium]|uniref:fatty acid desaturase n=1 Tax=Shimia thalassica TaxID=1715693 RepID=UPI003296D396
MQNDRELQAMHETSIVESAIDDHSGDAKAFRAFLLESGITLSDLTADLTPKYATVWRDIAVGYTGLLSSQLVVMYLSNQFADGLVFVVLLGAALVGFFMAYLQLFTHEAAHRNLVPDPILNDRLANALLTIWLGQDIRDYRRIHFKHHRKLGTPEDPERSYFQEPSWRLLLETLFLVHLFRVFSMHRDTQTNRDKQRPGVSKYLQFGIFLNAAVVLGLLWGLGLPSAISWVLGVMCFFPCFSTWRQLLEHRSPNAKAGVDYAKVPQGAYTRMFGKTLFERLFGGAGFNRHLLHHWVPEVSYTQFDELQNRLVKFVQTDDIIAARRSGYLTALKLLVDQKGA